MRAQVVLASFMWVVPVAAQVPSAAPADTITVTAYRTPQGLERSGSAISVVTGDEIESRQAIVSAEALRTVPGLAISRSGPFGAQTQIRMRGAEANQVLVLIDGIEANDPATADEFSFEHLTTFDTDRIEVVRGPQSALWGSDALAGVINVITRTPKEPVEAAAMLEGGSFGMVNGGARFGLRSERVALLLSGSRVSTAGTNVSRSGSEDDGYENTSLMLNSSVRLAPAVDLTFSARHTDSAKDFDDDSLTGLPVDADNKTNAEQTYLQGGARAQLFGGRWLHNLRYAVTATDTSTSTENFFTPEPDHDQLATAGDKYGLYYQTSVRLQPDTAARPGDLLTLALDSERVEFSQRGFGGFADQDQGLRSTGIAAEYLLYPADDVALSASIRHDHNSDFKDATTWRATGSYAFPEAATRLHASLGTGQKAPTFAERFGFFPGSFVGNPGLKPETSRGWDAGIEKRLADGRLVGDVTYFHADLSDEINGNVPVNPGDPFDFTRTAANEAGKSRRKGVEVSVAADLAGPYTLSASYTYTDATEAASGDQRREVRRPLHAGSVNLNSRWLGNRLNLNVGAAYTGDRQDDFFGPPSYSGQRVTLDAYTLVTVAAAYRVTDAVEIHARVENALGEDYEDVYGYNTPGAAAYAGVRINLQR